MKRRTILQYGLGTGAAAATGICLAPSARAENFLSAQEAQTIIWPDVELTPRAITLSTEQAKAIRNASSMAVHQRTLRAWRSSAGDWFLLDQVIGKHEFIDMAVGISRIGAIVGIEILTYRESYGSEIRNPKWRAQFHGKSAAAIPLQLDREIRNISGATLSCRHITDGINRLLATWELVLRPMS